MFKWHVSSLVKIALPLILVALFGCVSACGDRKSPPDNLPADRGTTQDPENSLIFKDVTLEQIDDQGQLLWKVQAKQAKYRKDAKIAIVESPTGDLYQDGKLVFQVAARTGEVQQDGKTIFLKDEIVATAVEDGAVLRGDELEWRPQEDLLIVRDNLTGTHPQLDASADEARVVSRERRMILQGNVKAVTKSPKLEMKTEQLVWLMAQETVTGDQAIEIERYEEETVTDRAVAKASFVDLKGKTATLSQEAKLTIANPPLQVLSDSITWDLEAEIVGANQLIEIEHTQQDITISADGGSVDLDKNIANLTGNVRGVEKNNQSQLESDRLTWNIASQEMEAEGNVTYRQLNPVLTLTGTKALGKLTDQTVVVTGGSSNRVVTEIIP